MLPNPDKTQKREVGAFVKMEVVLFIYPDVCVRTQIFSPYNARETFKGRSMFIDIHKESIWYFKMVLIFML